MKKVISISGGRTSAYIAANYECDNMVFSLVRTENKNCLFPDSFIRKYVSDRIQNDFIGTIEDNIIIYTMLDLEQFLGRGIDWVTGKTFENVCKTGFLPNKQRRFCTTMLKLEPIFYWWAEKFNKEPVEMAIGYRANETSRIKEMLDKCNKNGFNTFKGTFEQNNRGQNKWIELEWRKPVFPLFDDLIYSDTIINYWQNKPVRFADYNNCIGCFHRSPDFLRLMYEKHPAQFNAFCEIEKLGKGTFKEHISYEKVKNLYLQSNFLTSSGCSDGFCEP